MLVDVLGTLIKTRRKELGISQVVLAEIADVSKNTIYKLERGLNNPTVEVLGKLMDVLGLEMDIRVKKT